MILNIFFSIKLIRQFRRAKKISRRINYRKYYRKTLFFKIQEGACDAAHLPPLQWIMYCDQNSFWTRYDVGMEVKRGQGVVPPPCHLLFLCRLLLLLDQVALVTPIILRGNLSGFLRDLPLLIP
jgi:hypothetical protein